MSTFESPEKRPSISRRALVAGVGATAIAAPNAKLTAAQDATASPAAVPTTDPVPLSPPIPPEVTEFANDWPVAQGNLEATRTARASSINSSNVNTLEVAWELSLTTVSAFGAITSNPIVLGDTIYLIDNACNVYAIEKETGTVKWYNEYNVTTLGPNGLAIGYGYLVGVLGDDCTVITLKPETGEEVWRFQLSNHASLGITMAPMIYDGYIIVSTEPGGNIKGSYLGGANGVVYALDLQTGTTLWTWDTVKDDLWGNFKVNGGGGLWYPPSVDTDTGVLYMGIGNGSPWPGTEEYPNGSSRPGPNDYANCLVALDPNAGRVLWYINVKPHDLFDHDNQHTPVIADVDIDGTPRKLVFSTGKHGFLVAADRETGNEFWRVPVGKHQNDELQAIPDGETIEVFPGPGGGVQAPIAYADGVVYLAIQNFAGSFKSTGLEWTGAEFASSTGQVIALDAATGSVLWDSPVPIGIAGPGPTLANDVLFTGGLDGIVRAYNTADGSLIWSQQVTAGLNAPYAIAGDYLFVPAGSFIIPSSDTQGEPPTYAAKLIAYKVGGSAEATPTA